MSSDNPHTYYATNSTVLTQHVGVADQLRAGSRWFDVRPCSTGQYSDWAASLVAGHYSAIGSLGDYLQLSPTWSAVIRYELGDNIENTWQGGNGESISSMINAVNSFTAQHNELVILNISQMFNVEDPGTNNGGLKTIQSEAFTTLLKELAVVKHLVTAEMFREVVAARGDAWKDPLNWTLGDFLTPCGGKMQPAVVVVFDDNIMSTNAGHWTPAGWSNPDFWPPTEFVMGFADFSSFGLHRETWSGVLPLQVKSVPDGNQLVQAYYELLCPADPPTHPTNFIPTTPLYGISTDHTPSGFEAVVAWANDSDSTGLLKLLFEAGGGLNSNPAHYATTYMSDQNRKSLLLPLLFAWQLSPIDRIPSKISGDCVGLNSPSSTMVTDFAILFNMKKYNYFIV